MIIFDSDVVKISAWCKFLAGIVSSIGVLGNADSLTGPLRRH